LKEAAAISFFTRFLFGLPSFTATIGAGNPKHNRTCRKTDRKTLLHEFWKYLSGPHVASIFSRARRFRAFLFDKGQFLCQSIN
jgi:hypothetical protein